MKEYFFEQRGLYYRTNDLRHGRVTLVFIHGLSGSSSAWIPYEPFFERDYNVVLLDMRGHGKSLKPTRYEDYDIATIASDIVALLDYLHIGAYVPISHSLSTVIALSLLKQRPGAVAAVFMSPLYGTQKLLLTRVSRFIVWVGVSVARFFRFSNKPGGHTDYSKLIPVWDWSPRLIRREIPNTTLHVFLFCLQYLYAKDFDNDWDVVRMPTLIIHGEKDTVSPIWCSRKLIERLPHAKLVVMPNDNHIMPLNNVPGVSTVLSSYLREVVPASVVGLGNGGA